jgi:HJR/Mrr/RecB family endonuclease
MASSSRRNHRGKYTKNTNDHIFFVLIILLAAAVYADQTKNLVREQAILELVLIATGIVGCIALIKFLRKLIVHNAAHIPSNSPVDAMSGIEFERYVANLLPRQGYNHIQLTEHYDLGLDIIAEKEDELWGIQVKCYSGPVKIAAIRQVVAALKHYGCDRAMVVTNNSFSLPAQNLAKSNNCLLVDRQQLTRWAKDI